MLLGALLGLLAVAFHLPRLFQRINLGFDDKVEMIGVHFDIRSAAAFAIQVDFGAYLAALSGSEGNAGIC